MVRPPELVVTEEPRFAGAFFGIAEKLKHVTGRLKFGMCCFAHSDIGGIANPGPMSQEKLALYSMLFGAGLVVIAALVIAAFTF